MTLKSSSWMELGNCRDVDTKVFFPDEADFSKVARAKSYCNHGSTEGGPCPVRQECLEYARRNKIVDGIWGGLTLKGRDLETAMNFSAAAFHTSLLSSIPHAPSHPVHVALSFLSYTSSPSTHTPPVLSSPSALQPSLPDVVLLPGQTLSVATESRSHLCDDGCKHCLSSSSDLLRSPQSPKRPVLQFRLTFGTSSPLPPVNESRPQRKVPEFHLSSLR